VTLRRTIVSLATGVALTMGVSAAPSAAQAPDGEAAEILSTAPTGDPVTVVKTVETADGPTFTTIVADSRAEALELIDSALGEPGVTVDVAHPISIAGTVDASARKRSNDSQRKRQWALSHLGAEKVWRKSKGKGAVVAVIDTGVWAKHPDLKGRVLKGWDFIESDSSAGDRNGHGTHVAGVVAATANNRRGIAGLAPSAKILPVRVLNAAGSGNTATVARGIRYAVRKGADVINLSLAGEFSDAQLSSAISYARRKNVVVVAAAGNRGCSARTTYPAAYPGVIGVGAMQRNGAIAPYSNCGPYVDLVAPGSGIQSTMIRQPSLSMPCAYGKTYCMLDGTSMASPHVAAAAAILVSRSKNRLRATKIRQILSTRTTDIGAPGYDTSSGFGRLNVQRALAGR
jgi:type VII secretion-associated serine protease mycosin